MLVDLGKYILSSDAHLQFHVYYLSWFFFDTQDMTGPHLYSPVTPPPPSPSLFSLTEQFHLPSATVPIKTLPSPLTHPAVPVLLITILSKTQYNAITNWHGKFWIIEIFQDSSPAAMGPTPPLAVWRRSGMTNLPACWHSVASYHLSCVLLCDCVTHVMSERGTVDPAGGK